jgi:RNA polymerase sigma factor (sigma-70 family)
MPLTDEALLSDALRSGEREKIEKAFTTIYCAYAKLVSFCVAKYVEDPESVKDITNDVFLSFFQNAAKVKGSVKYYLLQSARNAAINFARKAARTTLIEKEEEIPAEGSFQSASFYQELVEDLHRHLTPQESEILLLHVVEGYSFKEIAQKIHLKPTSANVIYFRAIRKYRKSQKEKNR